MSRSTTSKSLLTLVEGGIIVAICLVLQWIPNSTGVSSIQFSYGLIPLAIYAIRRGTIPAVIAGGIWGTLDWIRTGGGVTFGPQQIILEYPVAFALAGFVGLGTYQVVKAIKHDKLNRAYGLMLVYFAIGTFAKYLAHFIAGGWFWGAYAPKWANPWVWSLIVNGGSAVANIILAVVLFGILIKKYPKLFLTN